MVSHASLENSRDAPLTTTRRTHVRTHFPLHQSIPDGLFQCIYMHHEIVVAPSRGFRYTGPSTVSWRITMKSSSRLLASVLAVLFLLAPHVASASVGTCIGTISIIVEQGATSTAHLISFANTGCTDACGASRRAYIEFSDKPLFATALSAALAGTTVGVMYDTAASSKGSSSSEHNSNVTCKVLNIFK